MNVLQIRVDKSSPLPIYHQLQQELIKLIKAGELEPGVCLPSENELARTYKISPMTVRQAMSALVKEGYIYRAKGRGTFVSARRVEHKLDRLTGFSEDIANRAMTPGSRILLVEEVAPPPKVLERVELPEGSLMTHIKRVRLVNGQPVGIQNVYLLGVALTQAELEHYQSLYKLLEARGIQIGEGEEAIQAVAATEEFARLIPGVKVGAPLLQTTRFSWEVSGKFIEYGQAQYCAELYQYNVHLKR